MLSGTVCPGARTFLSGHLSVIAVAAVQPTDLIGMGRDEACVKTGQGPFRAPFVWRQEEDHRPLGRADFSSGPAGFFGGGESRAISSFRAICWVAGSAIPSTCAGRK